MCRLQGPFRNSRSQGDFFVVPVCVPPYRWRIHDRLVLPTLMQGVAVLPRNGGGSVLCDIGGAGGHHGDIQGAGTIAMPLSTERAKPFVCGLSFVRPRPYEGWYAVVGSCRCSLVPTQSGIETETERARRLFHVCVGFAFFDLDATRCVSVSRRCWS